MKKSTRENEHRNHNPYKGLISLSKDTQINALVVETQAYPVIRSDDDKRIKEGNFFVFKGTRFSNVPIEKSDFEVLKKNYTYPKSDIRDMNRCIKKSMRLADKSSDDTEKPESIVEEEPINESVKTEPSITEFDSVVEEIEAEDSIFRKRDSLAVSTDITAYNELVIEHGMLSEELKRNSKYEKLIPVEIKYDTTSIQRETEETRLEIEILRDEITDLVTKLTEKRETLESDIAKLDTIEKDILDSVNTQILKLEEQSQVIYNNTPTIISEIESMKHEQEKQSEILETLAKLKELTGVDYVPANSEAAVNVGFDEEKQKDSNIPIHLYNIRRKISKENPSREVFEEVSKLSFEMKLPIAEFCLQVLGMTTTTFYSRIVPILKKFDLDYYRSNTGRYIRKSKK